MFSIEESASIKDIEDGNYKIVPIERVFDDSLKEVVDSKIEKQILNGKILDNIYSKEKIVFLNEQGEVLALYEKYLKDNNKIKPTKVIKTNRF